MEKSFEIVSTMYGNFLINEFDYIGEHIKRRENWEPHLYEFYSQILTKDDVCVDAGANLGFHTVQFGKLSKKVYAFEPQPMIFNQLCSNILLNDSLDYGIFDNTFLIGGGEIANNEAGTINQNTVVGISGNITNSIQSNNLGTTFSIVNNTISVTIAQNTCTGNIDENIGNAILFNSCGNISYNNSGIIQFNTNSGTIEYNTCPLIESNSNSGTISYNSVRFRILNNSGPGVGDITDNDVYSIENNS
jgi:FkbM family methyltransferase